MYPDFIRRRMVAGHRKQDQILQTNLKQNQSSNEKYHWRNLKMLGWVEYGAGLFLQAGGDEQMYGSCTGLTCITWRQTAGEQVATPRSQHRDRQHKSRRRLIFSISREGFQQWHVVICKREGRPVHLCCLCVAACVFWKPFTHCFTSWQLRTAQTRHNIWKLSIVASQQARAAQLIGRWQSGTLKQCTLHEERDVRKGRKG